MGIADAEEIINGLAEQFDYKTVNPLTIAIQDEVIGSVSKNIAKKYNIIPINEQNGNLTVAMSNPFDMAAMEDLRFTLSTNIECVLATSNNIEEAIKKYYEKAQEQDQEHEKDISFDGLFGELDETNIEVTEKYEFDTEEEEKVDEGPIVKLVSYIIEQAVKWQGQRYPH